MSKPRRIMLLIPAWNEEARIGSVLDRIPADVADAVLVIDDGSTDATAEIARSRGAEVLSMGSVRGVGAALRVGLECAVERQFEMVVIMAGNDKDEPGEIPRLTRPVLDDEADFVMGSRYLPGGRHGGDMPAYRKWATRVHPLLLTLFTRRRITESTNGFRAIRLNMLAHPRINLRQRWLDGYGLEVYLLFKALTLGFRHREVPCTKIYPDKKHGVTKMKPVIGWWDILKPVCLLGLGLRT